MAIHLNKLAWILVVALAVLLFLSVRSCNKNQQAHSELEDMLLASRDTTKYYQNKLGEEVATRRAVEGSIDNMRNFFSEDQKRELEERFDTKFKELRAMINVESHGETTLTSSDKPFVYYRDRPAEAYRRMEAPANMYMTQHFNNKYYDLNVRVGDSAYALLKSWDKLSLVLKDTVTGGLFNRKRYSVANIVGENPDNHYTLSGVYLVNRAEARHQFDLSAKGGWRYFKGIPDLSVPFAGAEGTYRTGRLSLSGGYNKLIGGSNDYFIELSSKFILLKF